MNSVNLYDKSWLDLVFDGKNKSYGAYQLRQESSKTTLLAFFIGLLIVGFISAFGLLLDSDKIIVASTVPPLDKVISVSQFNLPKPEAAILPLATKKKVEKKEKIEKKDLQNAVITKTDEADEIKTNKEKKDNPESENDGKDTGIVIATGTISGASNVVGTTSGTADKGSDEKTVIVGALDKMPEYPGGINRFYKFVGDNFEKPELNISTASVIMSFVIEKDGSMSDIKVLRSPGYGLDREAIRVLKSSRTKWKPGIKDGKPVRTLYTLPIIVKI